MQLLGVYLFDGRILVAVSSQTVSEIWYMTGPFEEVGFDVPPSRLGEVVLSMLDKSKNGLKDPSPDAPADRGLLRLAGVRSWSALERGSKCVDVTRLGTSVELTVMEAAPRGGFVPGLALKLAAPTPEVLGSSLRSLLCDRSATVG